MKNKTRNNKSICHIDSERNKFWKNKQRQYHRLDGPAIKCINGYKAWWVNGKLHREDGPAVDWNNGHIEYWINGQRHREDGAAVQSINSYKEWWINDVQYHIEKAYWLKIYKMKLITKEELLLKLL